MLFQAPSEHQLVPSGHFNNIFSCCYMHQVIISGYFTSNNPGAILCLFCLQLWPIVGYFKLDSFIYKVCG
jgi:hypothetical protein